jgi:hypothetical protein
VGYDLHFSTHLERKDFYNGNHVCGWMNRVILRKFNFLAMFVNFSSFLCHHGAKIQPTNNKMLDVTSWKEINK